MKKRMLKVDISEGESGISPRMMKRKITLKGGEGPNWVICSLILS